MLDGLGVRFDRAKHAAQSYVHDRVDQTEATAVSYAIAAGLSAAAGIFLIAVLLVGATAGFKWIELRYGLFEAFGALGGLMALVTILCAMLATFRLKRPAKRVVPLAGRLRVAISALPSSTDLTPDTAVSALPDHPGRSGKSIVPGLLIIVSLMGWAFVRRRASN
jgi:hypothetical protein